MTSMGVPVPPGFVISTAVCAKYSKTGKYPSGLEAEVEAHLSRLERVTGKVFGDGENPLLVSVRSGAPASMPGMMDTILNLGLNARGRRPVSGTRRGSASRCDCRRRLISDVRRRRSGGAEDRVRAPSRPRANARASRPTRSSPRRTFALSRRNTWRWFEAGQATSRRTRRNSSGAPSGRCFSWDNDRARSTASSTTSRSLGTAVNVQAWSSAISGDDCATGVAFTRNPATGERLVLRRIPPERAGRRRGRRNPDAAADLARAGRFRRGRFPRGDDARVLRPASATFARRSRRTTRTCRTSSSRSSGGKLYMLQTRNGKRTGFAACTSPAISSTKRRSRRDRRCARIDPDMLDPAAGADSRRQGRGARQGRGPRLGRGLPAGPGAACGWVAFQRRTRGRDGATGRQGAPGAGRNHRPKTSAAWSRPMGS